MLPLDICVAMTQGEIGFALQNSLQMAFQKHNIHRPVVTIITQVVVDKNDPAFMRPTKPIGPFYSKETAERKRKELGWNIIEDAARGYRRVVASPLPKDIVEYDVIKSCLERGIVVVAAGGGGIPVILENGEVKGVEAVIDKDRASAMLAAKLGIEHFIISTEVPGSVHSLQEIESAKITRYHHGRGTETLRGWPIQRRKHETEDRSCSRLSQARRQTGDDYGSGTSYRRPRW